jgi:hypothetical protein
MRKTRQISIVPTNDGDRCSILLTIAERLANNSPSTYYSDSPSNRTVAKIDHSYAGVMRDYLSAPWKENSAQNKPSLFAVQLAVLLRERTASLPRANRARSPNATADWWQQIKQRGLSQSVRRLEEVWIGSIRFRWPPWKLTLEMGFNFFTTKRVFRVGQYDGIHHSAAFDLSGEKRLLEFLGGEFHSSTICGAFWSIRRSCSAPQAIVSRWYA